MNKFGMWLCVGLLAAIVSGCRTVPFSERSQLLLTSSSYENQLGVEAYNEYKKQLPRSTNAKYNQALARVGEAIKNVAQADGFEWEFIVLESSTANAFCLPGGKVAVYSGLFSFTANEAELACVVAHEIGHAIARHGGERMSWAQLQSLGAWTLSTTMQNSTINSIYGLGTNLGVMLPFSRSNESEADAIGLTLMARAGYDPKASITFWQKFGAGQPSSKIEQWMSTHPSGNTRIKDLQERMAEAELEYRNAKTKRGLGASLQ